MNKLKDYEHLNRQLKQAGIALSGAELHGFLSGMICGGIKDQSWQTLLYQFTNDNYAYPSTLLNHVSLLYQEIQQQLSDQDSFTFELGFPPELSVFERAHALAEWTNHFLLGIGLAQPRLDKVSGDVAEVLDDLQKVAQLGYDDDDDPQELDQALEEVIEYMRVITVLLYSHFIQQPQARTILH